MALESRDFRIGNSTSIKQSPFMTPQMSYKVVTCLW